jgi:hypothetical protein
MPADARVHASWPRPPATTATTSTTSTTVSEPSNPGAATMTSPGNDYGLWGLVVVNSIIFIGFA